MANNNQDWEVIGRNIQQIIDQAINSQDYRTLNQNITRTVNHAIDVGGEAVRRAVDTASRAVDNASRAADNASRAARASRKPVIVEQAPAFPLLYSSTEGRTAVGIGKIVGGSLLSCVGFFGLLSTAVLAAVAGASVVPTVFGAIGLGGGIGLICAGVQGLDRVNRFKKYCRTLGANTHCSLEKLARSVGKNVRFVRKDLVKMIHDGYFLEGHLDKEGTCLITSHETYRQYEHSRLELEARKQEQQRLEEAKQAVKPAEKPAPAPDSRVQEVLDRGNAFLAEIRRCNDAIPGEEISGKISRMELIVRRIFDRAQAHPEIVPDLKKLMDYYLPMTVKLLNAYSDMDAQPVQGENIRTAKQEIEATLDTLNLAFEKLLDSVFEDTVLDVSSDISVLNTLLAQEGLTDDDISKLKKREN